ncbi:helix-turn-helix domain-containing protein [Nonomuraea sp. NPDC049400]|uniref:helix-turn-helix domain-containing protein n=1 Tax=Nonomuraea sp. NPDC049400 TaxID=3364352 RepID=UPI0037B2A358
MHGSKWRELETEPRTWSWPLGWHTRPGNRRYRRPQALPPGETTAPAPDPTATCRERGDPPPSEPTIHELSSQMTAQEIATRTGISKSTISRILNGQRSGTARAR